MNTKAQNLGEDALKALLRQAQSIRMSPEQEKEQRISFVYGNTHIENERITREMVESIDAAVSASGNSKT
jgi:hypothetical protein